VAWATPTVAGSQKPGPDAETRAQLEVAPFPYTVTVVSSEILLAFIHENNPEIFTVFSCFTTVVLYESGKEALNVSTE